MDYTKYKSRVFIENSWIPGQEPIADFYLCDGRIYRKKYTHTAIFMDSGNAKNT